MVNHFYANATSYGPKPISCFKIKELHSRLTYEWTLQRSKNLLENVGYGNIGCSFHMYMWRPKLVFSFLNIIFLYFCGRNLTRVNSKRPGNGVTQRYE